MGFEAFDRVEKEYQTAIARLDKIAKRVYFGDCGFFLAAMTSLWMKADNSDKRILRSAFEAIVTKYNLEEEASG